MDSATLNKALDRLQAASLDASKGAAYTCGPPWFRNSSGVLVGSPDPHAGKMIADTDTSLLDPDNHAEIDDDCNAIFLAEAWNFARMLLGSPALLDALRSTGTGRSEAEAMREAVENALTEWTRPSAIRLMVGETTTRQEGRTANAVAAAVASKVRAALNPPTREGEGDQP